MEVSSVHWPGSREKGPPPTMSVIGSKVLGDLNSRVVPRASPAASPKSPPWKRERRSMTSDGRFGRQPDRHDCFFSGTWAPRMSQGPPAQRAVTDYVKKSSEAGAVAGRGAPPPSPAASSQLRGGLGSADSACARGAYSSWAASGQGARYGDASTSTITSFLRRNQSEKGEL